VTDKGNLGNDDLHGISVVIPSYRRTDILIDVLRDLNFQNITDFEILLVLQVRPTRGEFAGLEAVSPNHLRGFYVAEPNASLARNVGIKEARYEIILFLDDDVRIGDPNFLEKHLRNFSDPTVPGVYGQVLEAGQVPIYEPEPSFFEDTLAGKRPPGNYGRRCRTRDGASNNLSVRRGWAVEVGGMDAHFIRGARREETEFNLRYTKKFGPLVFDPTASLIHLSAEGGSRNWGHVRRMVPMHHIVGHWYFLLASIRNGVMTPRMIFSELRHIAVALLKNPQRGLSPLTFIGNFGRALWGLGLATRCLLAGPRRLTSLDSTHYETLTDQLSSQFGRSAVANAD
jgi:glycosyltransferase involved in cell wall biosynthesis